MTFIAYLLAGLSIAAAPAQSSQSGASTPPAASSTAPQADQSKPPTSTAESPSQAQEPYHHAKAQKHFAPSHKEAAESGTMRKRDAANQGKKSAKKAPARSTRSETAAEPQTR